MDLTAEMGLFRLMKQQAESFTPMVLIFKDGVKKAAVDLKSVKHESDLYGGFRLYEALEADTFFYVFASGTVLHFIWNNGPLIFTAHWKDDEDSPSLPVLSQGTFPALEGGQQDLDAILSELKSLGYEVYMFGDQ